MKELSRSMFDKDMNKSLVSCFFDSRCTCSSSSLIVATDITTTTTSTTTTLGHKQQQNSRSLPRCLLGCVLDIKRRVQNVSQVSVQFLQKLRFRLGSIKNWKTCWPTIFVNEGYFCHTL